MRFIPLNKTLLCRKIVDDFSTVVENSVCFEKSQQPEYEVLAKSEDFENQMINIGDVVLTNSIPTKINNETNEYYLLSEKYLTGVISK